MKSTTKYFSFKKIWTRFY